MDIDPHHLAEHLEQAVQDEAFKQEQLMQNRVDVILADATLLRDAVDTYCTDKKQWGYYDICVHEFVTDAGSTKLKDFISAAALWCIRENER